MLSLRLYLTVLCAVPALALAQEICTNGTDDDADGLIDLNDPECPCSTAITPENVESYINNHSFEEQVQGPNGPCCPFGFVSAFSPPWLSCAAGWFQATSATSDYFHECGYSPPGFPLPPPDGLGALGFYAFQGYMEYVGTCLTIASPPQPLLAGTSYTISMWVSAVAANGDHTQSITEADPSVFPDLLPLAIFGYANACVPFPIGTEACIGLQPGWQELGRVEYQPTGEWTRVSITFTPTEEIHSVIIGGACDLPASFAPQIISDDFGDELEVMPYFLIDELLLTIAQDQVLSPVSTSGSICAEDALAVGIPPDGATDLQWYHNGVAIPGQTSATLDVSAVGTGGGLYTLASTYQGQCLMGAAAVIQPEEPVPSLTIGPVNGCAPLMVLFDDVTANSVTSQWTFGDGGSGEDPMELHTYATPGTYDVTLTVTDAAGCSGDTLIENAVVVAGAPAALLGATPNPTDVENTQVNLTAAGSQGDIVSWWWDLGDVPPGTSTDPALIIDLPAVAGEYPIVLAVQTAAGCVDTVRSILIVTEPGVIELPNVFSPNGDGRNDRFLPLDYTGESGLMEIYNRWGQLVFTTKTLAQGWSGSDSPDGTYYYVVIPDDTTLSTLKGHVTLLR